MYHKSVWMCAFWTAVFEVADEGLSQCFVPEKKLWRMCDQIRHAPYADNVLFGSQTATSQRKETMSILIGEIVDHSCCDASAGLYNHFHHAPIPSAPHSIGSRLCGVWQLQYGVIPLPGH